MAKENKSRYALLGLLSICPGSGYDVKKFMQQSTSNFWNECYGQIYYHNQVWDTQVPGSTGLV